MKERILKQRCCKTEGCTSQFIPRNLLNVYCATCQVTRADRMAKRGNDDAKHQRNFNSHARYEKLMRAELGYK